MICLAGFHVVGGPYEDGEFERTLLDKFECEPRMVYESNCSIHPLIRVAHQFRIVHAESQAQRRRGLGVR